MAKRAAIAALTLLALAGPAAVSATGTSCATPQPAQFFRPCRKAASTAADAFCVGAPSSAFEDPSCIFSVGDATFNEQGDARTLVLTQGDPQKDQTGAAWHTDTFDLARGFNTSFEFKIADSTCDDTACGGDGFAFVLQRCVSTAWSFGGPPCASSSVRFAAVLQRSRALAVQRSSSMRIDHVRVLPPQAALPRFSRLP